MHVTSNSSAERKKKEGIAGATRPKVSGHSIALQSNNNSFQGIQSALVNYSKTPEADLLLHPS